MERYTKVSKIGESTYGCIYKGRNNTTGELVCLKFFETEYHSVDAIMIGANLTHPNIVNSKDTFVSGTTCCVVQEYMDMNLALYLAFTKNKKFPEALLKSYAYQLLNAISYLEANHLMHRNITASNILIDSDGYLKITGFSLITRYTPGEDYPPAFCSLWYRPPEIFAGVTKYDTSVDVWSAGCVIAEMVLGKPLFDFDSPEEILMSICQMVGTPESAVAIGVPHFTPQPLCRVLRTTDALLVDLISKLLNPEHSQRISASQALLHPYFADVSDGVRRMCTSN